MTLGRKIADARQARGWSQEKLAAELLLAAKTKKFQGLKIPKRSLRTWLVKLEREQLRRELSESTRDWLAAVLGENINEFRALPLVSQKADEARDEPQQFPFEELWVFSSRPIEVRDPMYARKMAPLFENPERRIVYFVPDVKIAEQLKGALTQAIGRELDTLSIVLTEAVLLAPHWILRHRGRRGEAPIVEGYIELQSSRREEIERTFLRLPQEHVNNVIGVFQTLGVLDVDFRYKPPSAPIAGKTGLPHLSVFI
ncbi:hypothetical protein [Opitutus terrae]|uniref:Uncharacterized protein n=1 Tax=Opitutus terrae (strain DSM 11246 / JCM 15787 / PB90-1) TaxID=452637 RepID=B1ZNN5_OPITP|nr:hypothetical protein [Opitutus terrae]ACB74465.1 hypothetical protein Oter_1178 [Opitutus terrae PB90-1]